MAPPRSRPALPSAAAPPLPPLRVPADVGGRWQSAGEPGEAPVDDAQLESAQEVTSRRPLPMGSTPSCCPCPWPAGARRCRPPPSAPLLPEERHDDEGTPRRVPGDPVRRGEAGVLERHGRLAVGADPVDAVRPGVAQPVLGSGPMPAVGEVEAPSGPTATSLRNLAPRTLIVATGAPVRRLKPRTASMSATQSVSPTIAIPLGALSTAPPRPPAMNFTESGLPSAL